MKKTLPSIRIEEETDKKIRQAITKYNSQPEILTELSLQNFRRIAYEILSRLILTGQDIKKLLTLKN